MHPTYVSVSRTLQGGEAWQWFHLAMPAQQQEARGRVGRGNTVRLIFTATLNLAP